MNNTEIIWKYFEEKNFSPYAIAGIMGNMYAESGLRENNLQDTYNQLLGLSDEQYTQKVDNGSYINFIHDSAGYGLAQWTYWSLKKELYDLCKSRKKSISDINCQLDCLYNQLQNHKLIEPLNSVTSVRAASDIFLTKFERPKDQSERIQIARANYGQEFYNQFANIPAPIQTPISPSSSCLGKGDQGPKVEQLQKNLIKLGYSCGAWGADGDFGNDTEKAVIKFQKEHGLDADGLVGPLTQAAIKTALEKLASASTPTPSPNEMYRIRLSWDNPTSQIGAYKVLDNAILACQKAGQNYKVFNSNGEIVYSISSTTQPVQTPDLNTEQPITPAIKYDGVKLGSSSKDERGEYRGGQAGDQTNKEVWILNWYDGGWTHVIRPKTPVLAEKIANACEKACNNNNIGYDQYERNTLYREALKVGMDFSKITTPCECDCSSLVSTCCIAAGLSTNIFYAGNNMRTTWNLVQACESTGQFNILTSTAYTKSKDYLKRGDILLSNGHTVIVLADGTKANQIAATVITASTYKVRITTNLLNVRLQPNINSSINGQVKKNDVFTIIEEREGWGRLKSGAGWINLDYTQRI